MCSGAKQLKVTKLRKRELGRYIDRSAELLRASHTCDASGQECAGRVYHVGIQWGRPCVCQCSDCGWRHAAEESGHLILRHGHRVILDPEIMLHDGEADVEVIRFRSLLYRVVIQRY